MSIISHQPMTIAMAAAARRCPICDSGPGIPCQPGKPPALHLGRFLDAYSAGAISREYLCAVVGELVTITHCALAGAA